MIKFEQTFLFGMNNFVLAVNRNSLLKHILYWTIFVLFWSFVWGLSDYEFFRNILIQINCLPSRMLLVYISIYFLFPKYFLKKKYFEFFVYYCVLVLLISICIQRPLMLWYVQPTYLPNWNDSNFFRSSEIINTALDINIAAILPLGYMFLKTFENLKESNYRLGEENVSLKENKAEVLEFRIDKSIHKVHPDQILYIESQRNNVLIKLLNSELVVRQNISAIQEMLPENEFIRIHRSFIISREKISSFSPAKIEVSGMIIPIGRKYKEEVKKLLGY